MNTQKQQNQLGGIPFEMVLNEALQKGAISLSRRLELEKLIQNR